MVKVEDQCLELEVQGGLLCKAQVCLVEAAPPSILWESGPLHIPALSGQYLYL